jgi:endonuclease/exonuclease/phosphatase family metal-dependent hydrolase
MEIRGGPSIKVATYNVHGCVGTDGRHDPARTAAVIAEMDADVVALQEFRYPADIALETRTPVVLTELEQYQCALGPARQERAHYFGNVLLSRHPIREVHRINLSIAHREPRAALAATIDIRGVELHVLSAHLGLRWSERKFQVRQMLDYLQAVSGSFIAVLGDFNDWLPGRSVLHVLDQHLGVSPTVKSFPVMRPLLALDRIWVQPHRSLGRVAIHQSALARRASDHYPVVAELLLPD